MTPPRTTLADTRRDDARTGQRDGHHPGDEADHSAQDALDSPEFEAIGAAPEQPAYGGADRCSQHKKKDRRAHHSRGAPRAVGDRR